MKIRLKLGVLYNGTLHHDVLVKILTVGGECQALEVISDLGSVSYTHLDVYKRQGFKNGLR